MSQNILFIGIGNMGSAIIKGCLSSKLLSPAEMTLFDIDQGKYVPLGVEGATFLTELPEQKNYAAIVLAVKPKEMDSMLKDLATRKIETGILISVAAGYSLEKMENAFGKKIPMARVMPNINALISAGMNVVSYNKSATKEGRQLVESIFKSIGEILVVEENKMNAVTGLSGSGPAFVFMFLQALADGGVKVGLTRDEALQLAIETVLGSAKTVKYSGMHPEKLKDMVASPGGTTIEGIHVLEQNKFRGLVMEAVEAAKKKADSLGGK